MGVAGIVGASVGANPLMSREPNPDRDAHWMQQALLQAQLAGDLDEVPIGAVLVQDDQLLAAGYNRPRLSDDPSAHAEIVALRNAGRRLGNYRFPGSSLYVTVEPCTMCAGALVHARVERLVFGATEQKSGAVSSTAEVLANPGLNHRIAVTSGVAEQACAALLQEFFQRKRGKV